MAQNRGDRSVAASGDDSGSALKEITVEERPYVPGNGPEK
jgi:hypothetical protein